MLILPTGAWVKKFIIFCGRHYCMIPNVKKAVFSFGTSVKEKKPSSLLSICTFKMKSNLTFLIFKNSCKTRNCKPLFKQILPWEKKLKTCQERPHLLSTSFIKEFYKTTTCSRQPLLSGPESCLLVQVWLYLAASTLLKLQYALNKNNCEIHCIQLIHGCKCSYKINPSIY